MIHRAPECCNFLAISQFVRLQLAALLRQGCFFFAIFHEATLYFFAFFTTVETRSYLQLQYQSNLSDFGNALDIRDKIGAHTT